MGISTVCTKYRFVVLYMHPTLSKSSLSKCPHTMLDGWPYEQLVWIMADDRLL